MGRGFLHPFGEVSVDVPLELFVVAVAEEVALGVQKDAVFVDASVGVRKFIAEVFEAAEFVLLSGYVGLSFAVF